MEYFIGAIATIIAVVIYDKFTKDAVVQMSRVGHNITYTQSYIFSLLSPLVPDNDYLKRLSPKKTQSRAHAKNAYLQIMFFEDKAYWIKDNKFYVADVEDGQIIEDSTKVVDTMTIDKVELDKMIFIVETLTKGDIDDRGITGNS